jgi:hypothetical protein
MGGPASGCTDGPASGVCRVTPPSGVGCAHCSSHEGLLAGIGGAAIAKQPFSESSLQSVAAKQAALRVSSEAGQFATQSDSEMGWPFASGNARPQAS